MLKFEPPVVLELDAHQVIGWRQLECVRLAVRRGRVWVTHANELHDHFLCAGQRLMLRPADKVVIEADGGAAQVAFMPMPAGERRRTIGAWLARRWPLVPLRPPAPAPR